MSAFGGKADMNACGCPLSRLLLGVKRTWGGALHLVVHCTCPLVTQSGHWLPWQTVELYGGAPSRAHAAMNKQSAITAPSSAQKKTSMSARTPRGGAPGMALRSAGNAKIMAPRAPISVTSISRTQRKTRVPTIETQNIITNMCSIDCKAEEGDCSCAAHYKLESKFVRLLRCDRLGLDIKPEHPFPSRNMDRQRVLLTTLGTIVRGQCHQRHISIQRVVANVSVLQIKVVTDFEKRLSNPYLQLFHLITACNLQNHDR